jgi:signal transduction histidine kinase
MLNGVDHMSWRVVSARVCAAIAVIAVTSSGAFAAERVTKEEAVALVKKAVEAIKSEGTDKAYAEIDDPSGRFVDRELYIAVTGPDGTMLANGAFKSLIGVNRIDTKDADGKPFIKERVELAKDNPSFWQSYKYLNPVTKMVEPKQMYCERLDTTTVCGGIYQ